MGTAYRGYVYPGGVPPTSSGIRHRGVGLAAIHTCDGVSPVHTKQYVS